MGHRTEMDHGRAAHGRRFHLGEIEKIVAVGEVEPGDVMTPAG